MKDGGKLSGAVALVAGGSRGAGRGIALALGDAGATVYVTGRTRRGDRVADGAPGTIDDTADEVTARGGRGIAVRVDHRSFEETRALVERIVEAHGHIDIAAVAAWAGNETQAGDEHAPGVAWNAPFWERDARRWDLTVDSGTRATYSVAHAVARPMVAARRGLVAVVTDWVDAPGQGNLCWSLAHRAMNEIVAFAGHDMAKHGVACVGLLPGFMRTERVLMAFERAPSLVETHGEPTETTEYVGRAVVALAADPRAVEKSGAVLEVGLLAQEYGFTDVDGTRPRWQPPSS
jgi:NAD(P)-dependent dehydrogenase (short-subunit alcohol dehydrogenase family)